MTFHVFVFNELQSRHYKRSEGNRANTPPRPDRNGKFLITRLIYHGGGLLNPSSYTHAAFCQYTA